MVTRRVSEESLEAAKSSLTRRVTNRLLRYAAKVNRPNGSLIRFALWQVFIKPHHSRSLNINSILRSTDEIGCEATNFLAV